MTDEVTQIDWEEVLMQNAELRAEIAQVHRELNAETNRAVAAEDAHDTCCAGADRLVDQVERLRAALEHMVDVFGPLGRMGAGGPALDEARAALGRDKDG